MSDEQTAVETPYDSSFEFGTEATGELNLAELEQDNFQTEQPPEGEQTLESDKPNANGEEEEGEGSETPKPDDQETTAKPEEKSELEGKEEASKGKWSDEQLKYFEGKGMGEIPFSESTEKLLKNTHEAEKRITEANQTISSVNANMGAIATALRHGDVESLQTIAKELGGELHVDTRTEDDHIKEITENYNSTYDAVNPVIDRINATVQGYANSAEQFTGQQVSALLGEVTQLLNGSLSSMEGKANESIQSINQKKAMRDEVSRQLGRPTGKAPTLYDRWSTNAEQAFAEFRKVDPKADEYMETLKSELGENSAFESAGVSVAKLFGFSPESASQSYKIAKALTLLKDHEAGNLEKNFYDKFKKEKSGAIGGAIGSNSGASLLKAPSKSAVDHNAWAREMGLNIK